MNIKYPENVRHDDGYGQAFRRAVLHGLCYRSNVDYDTPFLKRTINHAHAIGYWTGRVGAFQQTSKLKPVFEDFTASVLSEIKRLEQEIDR